MRTIATRAAVALLLRDADPADWLARKRDTLVLGVKRGLHLRPNGRSADFIAPSTSNGCAMACAYCYVARRKGHSNPVSVFVNIEQVCDAIARHAAKLGPKAEPNQVDPHAWVYDLGENGDLSVDALVSDNVRDLVATFRDLPNAKGSFATKYVNRDLLGYDPQGRTRVRFSLMPAHVARVVDVRTSPIDERIAAIDERSARAGELAAEVDAIRAIAARAAPTLATSSAAPVPARFLCVVWKRALPSAIAGLAVMMPQTTSDSSCAMELPYIAGIRVKASRSSLISVWRMTPSRTCGQTNLPPSSRL